jgi:hypothetical protein
MSERFAILNTEAPSTKSRGECTQENSKGNIFKQKPKPISADSSQEPSRDHSNRNQPNRNQPNRNQPNRNEPNMNTRTRNLFAGRQHAAKVPEFNVLEAAFPVLNETTVIASETSGDSYKEKIQKTKEENLVKRTVPPGWVIITHRKHNKQQCPSVGVEMERNPYYNPRGAQMILENRQAYREELNDILGDISPYWNMQTEVGADQQDNDETGYSEEEEDYVEDW